jgi:hypothetical protein
MVRGRGASPLLLRPSLWSGDHLSIVVVGVQTVECRVGPASFPSRHLRWEWEISMPLIKRAKPSPALIVAVVALVVALAGGAVAGVAVTSLNKREKKVVKRIASKQIRKKEPGLDVNSAKSADTANDADALGGVSLGDLNPVAEGIDTACSPVSGFNDCLPGASLTLNRTADVLVIVTAAWHDTGGLENQADCRIERNGAGIGTVNEYGSKVLDTDADQNRALAMNDIDANRPPGSYLYYLSCDEGINDFELEDVHTTAVALGS